MDLLKDYDAKDADVKLTEKGSSAILLFLTTEGWVGVTLGRDDLVRFQERIAHAISEPTPPGQRR